MAPQVEDPPRPVAPTELLSSPIQEGHPSNEDQHQQQQQQHGSSVAGAIFNFTNSIVGAGAIGLGGAIAVSGGAISVALILFFALLTKLSLDLVIRLSTETEGVRGSYEDLAKVGLGASGRFVVLACKFLYSFGCLVAYIVVVKDNFGSALGNLLYGPTSGAGSGGYEEHHHGEWLYKILQEDTWTTWILSSVFIFPLCLLRDMTPLASLSVVSIVSMIAIVVIVIYIYYGEPEVRQEGGTFYENWLEIRPGVLESLGTFVFTFVSQHTVHLVYGSLRPDLRTLSNFKTISSVAIGSSAAVSLAVGVFVYITFWQATESDIFQIYPASWMIDVAKLLLCITMLLTFPLPFFTCRELIIVTLLHPFCLPPTNDNEIESNDLQEPLLDSEQQESENQDEEDPTSRWTSGDSMSIATDLSRVVLETVAVRKWLLEHDDRQLVLAGHVTLTGKLWFVTTCLAIAAPNLGDVLDLVGCASGTIIAFILPALISLRLEGYSHLAMLILLVGGTVGTVGTFYSLKKLFLDITI